MDQRTAASDSSARSTEITARRPRSRVGRSLAGRLGLLLALVPLGVWAVGKRWSQTGRLLVVGGSLLAPVPAVLLDAPRQAALASLLLPLAAVSGAAAIPVIAAMRRGRSAVMTAMVVLLLLTLTLAAK